MALEVRDLKKSFRTEEGKDRQVLSGVSFSVPNRSVAAIIGASGAGKSTLLHMIGGLETSDGGSVFLDAFDVTQAGERALKTYRSKQLGVIFQFHHLMPDLTAAENVAMPLMIQRRARGQSLRLAHEALADMGIGELAGNRVQTLSGGEQQRVAVARALATRPELVLADEPTGNLDAETGAEIEETLIRYARESGATVIVATHNLSLARLCDQHLRLQEGIVRAFDV